MQYIYSYTPKVNVPEKFEGDVHVTDNNISEAASNVLGIPQGLFISFSSDVDREAWQALEEDYEEQFQSEFDRVLKEMGYDLENEVDDDAKGGTSGCVPCVSEENLPSFPTGEAIYPQPQEEALGEDVNANYAPDEVKEGVRQSLLLKMGPSPATRLANEIMSGSYQEAETERVSYPTISQGP